MTEEEYIINKIKKVIPIDLLSNDEQLEARELAKKGYLYVVKFIKDIHPELGLKEAKCYYDLYLD